MSRFAYVNGRFVRHGEAAVHIEDRGYQLADGVYEVWAVFDGKLADAEGHFARLWRSLDELRIAHPMSEAALTMVLREAVRRNKVREGLCYLQVTRGVARRDHAFPNPAVLPSVVVTARSLDRAASEAKAAQGASVISVQENRWGRCDIKSIGLLPNALAKQAARERGAIEAWFVDDMGLVTEGASSNAWIVDAEGALRTRDTNANILRGVTRYTLLDVIRESGMVINEKPFTIAEAQSAREAFITGAGSLVTPIVQVDGVKLGDGKPGPVAKRLRALYIERARQKAV
ncbi:D-amino-acid transaminase [Caulobacter vibrioides]|uniref:Probable branched-chain-amino-acid aminotransferase n=2 Tax=Caulobacter vibrioides TaxID=155892 RepID=Q9A7H9_CAUVC|nr:D-amino-acid transaminase [Caulobacter vibrioides]YP_002517191.1 D-alanine aminotransferase [Caulobacter vibrioides NA1000]AAK23720.1 D-alanine aminotransferase, putative [Caulobacter vibrioides CB15]ACL95283.1 D-alanine aminotransferase [Caulobacter vibrioides NA1000]ATC28622.1 D-alanine aminotransferase [Caulobacter vibrioides]QXZ53802.1 D-amino-acid transaminase [Caulobacter vibrioides]